MKIRLFIALLSGCLSTTVSAQTATGWTSFNDSICTLSYPSEWELDQSGRMGSHLFLFVPSDNDGDGFRENINLIATDLSVYPGVTLDQIAEASKEQIKALIEDVQFLEVKKMEKTGAPYYYAEYTGRQSSYQLHWMQHFMVVKNLLYVITFSSTEKQFAANLPVAQQIFNSFEPR